MPCGREQTEGPGPRARARQNRSCSCYAEDGPQRPPASCTRCEHPPQRWRPAEWDGGGGGGRRSWLRQVQGHARWVGACEGRNPPGLWARVGTAAGQGARKTGSTMQLATSSLSNKKSKKNGRTFQKSSSTNIALAAFSRACGSRNGAGWASVRHGFGWGRPAGQLV